MPVLIASLTNKNPPLCQVLLINDHQTRAPTTCADRCSTPHSDDALLQMGQEIDRGYKIDGLSLQMLVCPGVITFLGYVGLRSESMTRMEALTASTPPG